MGIREAGTGSRETLNTIIQFRRLCQRLAPNSGTWSYRRNRSQSWCYAISLSRLARKTICCIMTKHCVAVSGLIGIWERCLQRPILSLYDTLESPLQTHSQTNTNFFEALPTSSHAEPTSRNDRRSTPAFLKLLLPLTLLRLSGSTRSWRTTRSIASRPTTNKYLWYNNNIKSQSAS